MEDKSWGKAERLCLDAYPKLLLERVRLGDFQNWESPRDMLSQEPKGWENSGFQLRGKNQDEVENCQPLDYEDQTRRYTDPGSSE